MAATAVGPAKSFSPAIPQSSACPPPELGAVDAVNPANRPVQTAAAAGKNKQADLGADEMGEVVDKVSERWLGSIDKEEPEIVDDFLYKMKDAMSAIHATEGYPKGKILKPDEDWLTKIVLNNKKMQDMIPKYDKEERKAIADS